LERMAGVQWQNHHCEHDRDECEAAVAVDGYCPFCMEAEIGRLRAKLELVEARLDAALEGDMDFARQGVIQVTG